MKSSSATLCGCLRATSFLQTRNSWSRVTFTCSRAALTGESMPAEKDAASSDKTIQGTPQDPATVFLGTSVVSGTAIARVIAIGPHTAFGAIAEKLAHRPQETEFERGLRHFGMLILRSVFFLVLFILVVRVVLHKDAFEFAVALAVGLTPEFLPMITSVTLARGAARMAKQKVVVEHLAAIQNFGSIDGFCSDKTGTLTAGEMTLQLWTDAAGGPSDRTLSLAYLNSKFETGIRSPLDSAVLKRAPGDAEGHDRRDSL